MSQHSRRPATRRLLLLTLAGCGIGLGITLALEQPAQAADTDAPAVKTAGALTQPSPQRQTPHRPVRDTVHTAATAVDDAVHATTAKVNDATAGQPIDGRAVDTATDATDKVLDTVEAAVSAAVPRLLDAVPAVDDLKPAPELTQGGPPTSPHVSSGAPTTATAGVLAPTARQWQHPGMAGRIAGATGAPRPSSPELTAGVVDPSTRHSDSDAHTSGDNTATAATGGQHHDGTITGRWAARPRWQQTVADHMHDQSGRALEPVAPSG